jgi:protoporphyrinogen/coproporphyrinogen III oxidase
MRVLVIGAGIAGIGAATYFARKGHDVEVREAGERVGGRAITLTSKRGDKVDAGTQYFHSNYRRALSLMDEAGLGGQVSPVAGPTRFFDTRSECGYFDVSHRLPWFPPAGLNNLKALGLIVRMLRASRDPFSLDYSPALDAANAWKELTDPFVRDFVLRPLMLAGALAEPSAAEPSLAHVLRLFRIVVMTNYLVLPGGVASLTAALAKKLRVSFGQPAKRLVIEGNNVAGVELANGQTLPADHVVVAVPPPAALPLLPQDWTAERQYLQSIAIPPFALVSLFLDRPLDKRVWSYMLPPQKTAVGFVTDALRKAPAMVPSGKSVLQAWICYPASQSFAALSDNDVVERCRRELEPYFPGLSTMIEEAHVNRHPYAVPFHTPGHQSRTVDFLRNVDLREGVSFCGDHMTGGFMEAALWSAERAAARFRHS